MRVLQVHNRYRSSLPSGENRVVDLERRCLVSAGHEVELFERSSDEIENWSVAKRALVAGRVLWSQDAYRALVQALRYHRPDVVHVHNVYPLLSSSVLYACARERVPVVATLHNYRLVCAPGSLFRDGAICSDCVGHLPAPAVRHGCYRDSKLATIPVAAAGQVHRHAWRTLVSAYVCISRSQRDLLAAFDLPADRVLVKYNLVPFVEEPPPRSGAGDTVVFVGRLDEAKGIPLLMQAWDLYSSEARNPALRLAIAGAGPLGETVSAWARGRSDVEVLGLLSPEACRALLTSARAAIAPSQWLEPFGLIVVEAMASGVGLIAPNHGAFPELLVDGQEGRLFEPGNARSLAALLQDAERSPDRYTWYGRNARRAYESRFDPDDNVRQLQSVYEFAIANPAWRDERQGGADPPRLKNVLAGRLGGEAIWAGDC
jgi:glycosyltransferase involved in cell wall biosynthesis